MEDRADFFATLKTLDISQQREIEKTAKIVTVPAHTVVYEQGAKADNVYIVVKGVVEALTFSPDRKHTRALAYGRRGNFFGELGVLTGNPRIATVRTCEETELLSFEKETFLRLLNNIPKLGIYFCRSISQRLYEETSHSTTSAYCAALGGHLNRFDLLSIFQAITGAGHSGQLLLNNPSNDLIGSFFFRDGRVQHARFAHLQGIEAVWQGFLQSATDGTFSFEIMEHPTLAFDEAFRIDLESTDLLMQGATKRDMLQALPTVLYTMKGRLGRKAELLEWHDAATAPIAARVWELIAKRPQPLETLFRRMNFCALTYLEVVNQLLENGTAELLPELPAGSQPYQSGPV